MLTQRILIQCPRSLQTIYEAPDRDFEEIDGEYYLRLPLDRSQYRLTKRYKNDPKYLRTLSEVQFHSSAYVKELEIAVSDERSHLYFLLEEIVARSISQDWQTQTAIRLIDFVLPERQDITVAIANKVEARTVRQGSITSPEPGGGIVAYEGRTWIQGGFKFRFEELRMRR